jgi:hypothetical protein
VRNLTSSGKVERRGLQRKWTWNYLVMWVNLVIVDCNWHQFLSYDDYARLFYIWEKVESFSSIRLQFLDIMNVRRREHSVSNEHPSLNLVLLQMDGWHIGFLCLYMSLWSYATQRLFFFNRYLLKSASEQVQMKAALSLYHHPTLHQHKRT